MTLLSWEWGRWRGMVRFLSWVDAIGERVRAPGAQGLPISSRLLGRFKVLGGLALGALGRRTLVAEAPPPPSTPPVVVVPQLLPLPVTPPPRAATPPPAPVSPVVLADTGSADTLAFVEELYGYREGELRRKFGQAAQDWAQEGADSATDLLGIAEIRLQLKGLGPNPDPDRITRVFAGWSRASVAPVELARLEPRYDWHQSGGIAAPVPTVTAIVPSDPLPYRHQQEDQEVFLEEPGLSASAAIDNTPTPEVVRVGSPEQHQDLVRSAMRLLLQQHPEVGRALVACGHDPSRIVLSLPPAVGAPDLGFGNNSSSDESGHESF